MVKLSRSQILTSIAQAIIEGEANEVASYIKKGLQISMSAREILEEALIPASHRLAEQFKGAEFNIPDVMLSSRAIKAGIYELQPLLPPIPSQAKKIVIGTVAGDIHDIGKNMVAFFLESAGFQVIDLGVDITAEKFIQAVRDHRPQVLALSALLTTTMGEMSTVIDLLASNHLRDKVKVIIGGGPVTSEFASFIGADAFAENALDAGDTIADLLHSS